MFKKYPYWGWLLVTLLCWGAAVSRFYALRKMATPKAMTELVSKDFQKRQKALDNFLADDSLVARMFDDRLNSEEIAALANAPFYIYAFKGGNLLSFWNTNTVVGTCGEELTKDNRNSLYRYNGTFYKQCLHPTSLDSNEQLVVMFPLRYRYALQNNYLPSFFVAADYIPISTTSSDDKQAGGYPVINAAGKPIFYLYFQNQDLPRYIPDLLLNVYFIAAMLSSLLWLHLIAMAIARKRKTIYGIGVIAASIVLILLIAYRYGAPFYLNEIALFSASLFSSSMFIPSLALLLIVLLCLLWLLLFVIDIVKAPVKKSSYTIVNILGIVVAITLLTAAAIIPVNIIRKLVLDGQLSFDVINLNAINRFTPLGLFAVVLILCCNTLIIYCCNFHLANLIKNKIVKYLLLAFSMVLYSLFVATSIPGCQYIFAATVFVFLLLFDFVFSRRKVKIFSPENLMAGIIITLSATLLLYHFNSKKKKIDEQVFAEKIVRQRDEMMEFLFKDIADSLSNDLLVQSYLQAPTREDRSFVDEHIGTRFLRGQPNRYQAVLYFFNADSQPVFNVDTLRKNTLDTILSRGVQSVFSPSLYYFENAKDGRYYIANIPMGQQAGTVSIALQLRQDVNASVYPELLEPEGIQEVAAEKNYTYGVYAKRELITQNNDYPFPVFLRSDSMKTGAKRILKREGYNINIYKVDDGRRVAIIETEERLLEMLTLFSYAFGLLMIGALVVFLLSFYIHFLFKDETNSLFQLTLRNRIHFAMLSMVMLTFLVLGAVTIFTFKTRYENTNKVKLRNAMQAVERAVQEYLKKDNKLLNDTVFNVETKTIKFKNFIAAFAETNKLDVNVYNVYGSLNATSQEDIYNKALLARIMVPKAYYNMSKEHSTLLVQNEQIGQLKYLSSYVPVRNINGQAVGYINVPFFSSQKELNYQISNILVAIINIYAFIFLVSSLLAVLITDWLTKGLQVLIGKFKTFDLKENETIAWKYDDEIGMLLREYNKMVEKVVTNAKKLAQSEREMAWREMAKQVAHEIKNPLTPMKLNIQYLQQALDKNHPNIEQLTKNVSASLIEQIDNLSHIASAFSDFAKMPEAAPESVVLNDVLKNTVSLFNKDHTNLIYFVDAPRKLAVYVDKDQLVRVFNNLLKNAQEAIPEERIAKIDVLLEEKEGKALVTIKDNGSGIAEDVMQHIFSPYFTTKGSGTGLGLAMTKKIVEFWNVKIWFETKQDVGTSFFIEVPLFEIDQKL